jgi:1-deoxy-D-xylulose 5-phosphate reductoisomerase
MVGLLDGATAMASLAVGTFFVRFWRESDDRLFPYLAAAFWIFAAGYAMLALLAPTDERSVYAFALRLIGFAAILVGVVRKQRELDHSLRARGRSHH